MGDRVAQREDHAWSGRARVVSQAAVAASGQGGPTGCRLAPASRLAPAAACQSSGHARARAAAGGTEGARVGARPSARSRKRAATAARACASGAGRIAARAASPGTATWHSAPSGRVPAGGRAATTRVSPGRRVATARRNAAPPDRPPLPEVPPVLPPTLPAPPPPPPPLAPPCPGDELDEQAGASATTMTTMRRNEACELRITMDLRDFRMRALRARVAQTASPGRFSHLPSPTGQATLRLARCFERTVRPLGKHRPPPHPPHHPPLPSHGCHDSHGGATWSEDQARL